jgi:hypothetical protein
MEETERMQQIMKDFKKVIVDMTLDILTTFPEMTILNTDLKNVCENTDDADETSLKVVFEHCKKVYPDKFFNILYQNESIFEDAADSEFLPGIAFTHLWQDALLSDSSRQVIWKYLQLLLFTIISTIKDKESFGDSAKLFESMNEDDLKTKLEETMAQMQDIFNTHKKENGATEGESEDINLEDMPNPQDIHDHVSGMLDGKLGKLAKEIAEETALDMNMDMNSSDSVNDVFKNLMKNPTKLMGIVKNVGNKLDAKMKSGDIKESELLKEASDIMEKMKNIPGMGNIQSMMEKMGMPMGGAGGGGKGKVNVNAFQDFMKKNMKAEKQKESMKAKLAARQQAQAQQAQAQQSQAQAQQTQAQAQQSQQAPQKIGTLKKVNDSLVFSTGEEVERSSANTSETPNKKKKKKKAKKTGVPTTKDTTEEE